jgi:hypothetical protein
MSSSRRPGGSPHNSQQINFGPGGTGFVNQSGPQINNITNINAPYVPPAPAPKARSRLGWVVLAFLALDIGFFFYGAAAYTGLANDTGDLWRAGIFVVLMITTGSLVRRWFHTR